MSPKNGCELIGKKALVAALAPLAPTIAKRVFKKASVAFAGETRNAIRSVIEKKTGNLRRAVKSKSTKSGGAVVFADRSGGSSGKGYHIHFQKSGTKTRRTKKGANRGAASPNERIQKVIDSQATRFLDRVGGVVMQAIKDQAAKAGVK